jgi:TonB family protein
MPGDSTQIEPSKLVKAGYPLEARQKGIQGQVWLRLYVSETGDVDKVEVISGDPALVPSAVEAAKKWKFKPFIKNGKPIRVSTKIPFSFAFGDQVTDVADEPAKRSSTEQPRPVDIASGIAQGLLIHRVTPVYPPEALADRIQGKVLLQAVIDTDGRIMDLKLISGPKRLVPSAIGAVQQWRYRPYLLDGKPVKVQTQVLVNYELR